jgi:hypothetical protein
VAACKTPTPQLRLELAGAESESQACPSTDCAMVGMPCDAVMSIQIADPANTGEPFINECVPVTRDPKGDMCSLAAIDLDPTPLPVRTLEVRIAVYPAAAIHKNADSRDGLECPMNVAYNATTGFPVENWPTPALGGRSWYRPGDDTVVVRLGCTDLESLTQSCPRTGPFRVTATVDNFDDLFPVPTGGPASTLRVSVGEPRSIDGTFQLSAEDTRTLLPVDHAGVTATWGDEIDLQFTRYACVEVIEVIAQTTASLRCFPVTQATPLDDLHGIRVSRDSLQKILRALSPTSPSPLAVPDQGLTIGIVADRTGPKHGMTVISSDGGIQYLRDGSLATDGTSDNGIFVAPDAKFGTVFTTSNGDTVISAVGGQVAGRVTVVVLKYGVSM